MKKIDWFLLVVVVGSLVMLLLFIHLAHRPAMTKPELARFVVECSDSVCSVMATNNEGGRLKLIGNLSPMDAQDMASHLYNTLRKQ